MIGNLGMPEILVILVIILLFFGAKRIPDLARSLGKGTREFRKGISEGAREDEAQEEDRKKEDAEKPPVDEATAEDESPRPKETEVIHSEQKS